MKGRLIALGRFGGREAAALVEDGRLQDLFVQPPAPRTPVPESIFRGRLGRPVKGLGGAFVDLPEGLTGFLRHARGLAPGQSLLVQVSGHAEPGKAVPLTTRLVFKGRHAIVTPDAPGVNIARSIRDKGTRALLDTVAQEAMAGAKDLGLILRSAAAEAGQERVQADIATLRRTAEDALTESAGAPALVVAAPGPHQLALREWSLTPADTCTHSDDAFARHGIDEMIDALFVPEVALKPAGTMIVEPTRALVAVDVNTGSNPGEAAGLKVNLAVARELPRQLRLRGLGGQIVIDFAPMSKRHRQAAEQALAAAFRQDGSETSLAGWTPLGNFELQRRRDRVPIVECLA